jgi:hypothetical protein
MASIDVRRTSPVAAVPTVMTLVTADADRLEGMRSPLVWQRALTTSGQGREVIQGHGQRKARPCRGRFAA